MDYSYLRFILSDKYDLCENVLIKVLGCDDNGLLFVFEYVLRNFFLLLLLK